MKEVNTQNRWTFELGSQGGVNIPIYFVVSFQQRVREDSQKLINDTFYRPPVTSAQCIIQTEKCPDKIIFLNYDDNDYSPDYGQIKEVFRAPKKDDILKPDISDKDFRSSNDDNDLGYNLYVIDIRYQKNLESAQPIKAEFNFSEDIPHGKYGYALVLTIKLVSISSDSQRHFDLI